MRQQTSDVKQLIAELQMEQAAIYAENKRADAAKIARDKRLRQIRKDLITLKGGAI